MSKHAELPWKIRSGEDTHWWFILEDKDGYEIGSGDGGLEEDDAYLIVNAVNNYERLREALEKMMQQAYTANGHYPSDGNETFAANEIEINQARALLQELDNLEQTK